MESSIDSGSAHVKYGHKSYPSKVDLVCNSCNSILTAKSNTDNDVYLDISLHQKDWKLQCSKCTFRQETDWDGLKQFKLWYKGDILSQEVWAWNKKHLDLIIKVIKKENVSHHPLKHFATYLPGTWLSKLNTPRAIKKLEALKEKLL